jgi:DNA polymerase elongation subunit (family B)
MQPCDWIDHDDYSGKYCIDIYGRNEDEECILLRVQGYKPYLYVGYEPELQKKLVGVVSRCTLTEQHKYDCFEGFNDYKTTHVWKVEVDSIKDYRNLSKFVKEKCKKVYEANLPPLLRFYHDHEILPASPLSYISSGKLKHPDLKAFLVHVTNIKSDPTRDIPLKISAYDIECMSKSGQFPVAKKTWDYVLSKIQKDLEEAPEDETYAMIFRKRLELEGLAKPLNVEAFVRANHIAIETGNWEAVEYELRRACGGNIGDPVIQIGVTFRWSNNMLKSVKRKVFVVGTVAKSTDDCEYFGFPTEADMIEGFESCIREENPDVICGYNTYGFDDGFLMTRAVMNGVKLNLARGSVWNRNPDDPLEHKTFELASGKYNVHYIPTPGRLTIDLLLNMRREHNLDSYTLDNVASNFLRDKVVKVEGPLIHTKTTRGLYVGNYIKLDLVGNTMNPYKDGKKFRVMALTAKTITLDEDIEAPKDSAMEWSFTKDDIHPHDLFRMHEGTADDRATIAKYCIQDCDLVLTLMAKLDTLVNARGMADVCFVPLQFLFLRGQGIKIFSRVAYEASKRNQILITQQSYDGDTGYEGAIVISPKIGMYLDTPIAVLDFNSLYPSSMIGENLSPDTFVCMKTYNNEGRLLSYEGLPADRAKGIPNCREVTYDIKNDDGKITGRCTCVYVQPTADNPLSVGLIPTALEIMLKKRKEARKKMEDPTIDDAQKSVYNGLQLAYKVVANSIYGQMGSKTSAIRKICVAACTTAVGRRQLLFAKETVEKEYGAEVVYGDTDSIFIKFPGKTLVESIKAAQDSAKLITSRCPHRAFVIGYEKTFYPFILFCRKRYVGMKYEEDPTKCKRAEMGIVLKRRDNAPIVKDVFGGALDILLLEKDVGKAVEYVKSMLLKVVKGDLPIEKFAITKQLRDDYKAMKADYDGPATVPAHRILADRMAARDPGNKPNVGDRLKFVHIQAPEKRLQCDKIEHIAYAAEKKLPLDTLFYVTNQIQNPVAQLFALCIEEIPGYRHPSVGKKKQTYQQLYEEYMETVEDQEQATLKVLAHKEKQLDNMLFLGADYIQNTIRRSRTGPLDAFFKPSGGAKKK